VERVGRFREGFEGAQDHDLILRCADASSPERIRHIPRILYHWRAAAGSTAASLATKPYAWKAGRRAIEEHLARHGVQARIERGLGLYYRVRCRAPDPAPFVTVIVASSLRPEVASKCLSSLLKLTTYPNFELLLLARAEDADAARTNETLREVLNDP